MTPYFRVVELPPNPLILGPLLAAYSHKTRAGYENARGVRIARKRRGYVPADHEAHLWPGRPLVDL